MTSHCLKKSAGIIKRLTDKGWIVGTGNTSVSASRTDALGQTLIVRIDFIDLNDDIYFILYDKCQSLNFFFYDD